MPTIKISITGKRATVEGAPIIICGNSDYTVAFTFDSEWASHGIKTARFAYKQGGEFRYEDVIFNGTTCPVPAILDTDLVAIGVYAGDLRTSTPAAVKCAPSILCLGKLPADPLPSVYNQLITLINTRTPADTAWHNVTANALKGYASGEVVTLFDVSPVEHELGVRVHGKNLFPSRAPGTSTTMVGVTITYNDDGSVTLKGTATSSSNFSPGEIYLSEGTYYLCDYAEGEYPNDTQARSQIYVYSTGQSMMVRNNHAAEHISSNQMPSAIVQCRIRIQTGGVYDCTLRPTLFKGEAPTEYTPYVDPTGAAVTVNGVEYTAADASGKITGIGSVSPSMTLTASTGMLVDVTYNRDITTAINRLEQLLQANA